MGTLTQRDYRAILDFLKEINCLQESEDFLSKVTAGLQTIVEGDIVTCLEVGPGLEDYTVCFSQPEFERLFPIWMRVSGDHPGWERLLSGRDQGWVRISDYLSETAYHRTALYNELWRFAGIEDNLGAVAMISPGRVAGVSINRDRRSFTERDREALNLLQPHLMQAWRNTRQTAHLREEIDSLAVTLETRAEGIVILDEKRKVRWMTARAGRYIEKYFGALRAGDRLPQKLDDWVARQQSLPQDGLETAPRRPWVLPYADGSDLNVICVPCRASVAVILREIGPWPAI